MGYEWEVFIPGLPRMGKGNARAHWRTQAKSKKEWEERVRIAFLGVVPKKPLERARIVLTRHSVGPEPDIDNLWNSMGPILDGLVKAGIIQDDRPSVLVEATATWKKAKRTDQGISIKITEA